MAVNVLVIGDPHFKVNNVRETDEMVNNIMEVSKTKEIDIIVVLGDILDRHETIHVSPLTRAIDFLQRLKEIAPVYVLIGNHDMKNNRQFLTKEHPFIALKGWTEDRMTICDEVTYREIKGKKFMFVPYLPHGRFIEGLETYEGEETWSEMDCIFAHQEFYGAQMGAIVSTEGDKWALDNPLVISGHIHDYNKLQDNILYVGTPIQHSFGDNINKTISYITFLRRGYNEERIDLKVRKKKIIRMTCEDVNTFVLPEHYDLKIIISGHSGDIKAIMKHHLISQWKSQGYKIVYKDIPLNVKDGIIEEIIMQKRKFSEVLLHRIEKEERLMTIYETIFGTKK